MRQTLNAPADAMPKSGNRMPSSQQLSRRHRLEPQS